MRRLVVLFALWTPIPGLAQLGPIEGDRVRVTRTDGSVVFGIYMSRAQGQISLRPTLGQEAPVVQLVDLDLIERSLGRQGRFWRHFGMTVAGSVIGFGVAVAATWEPCSNACNDFDDNRTEAALFYGTVIGAFAGVPLGVILGAAVKSERWETLSLAGGAVEGPFLSTSARGGLDLSVRLR